MMSAAEIFEAMGGHHWVWWAPITLGALMGLYYMALLSPPKSRLGALSRVLIISGFMFYIAAFVYGIMGHDRIMFGRMGIYCQVAGVVLLIRQIALACVEERKRLAESHPTFGRRVLAALVRDIE